MKRRLPLLLIAATLAATLSGCSLGGRTQRAHGSAGMTRAAGGPSAPASAAPRPIPAGLGAGNGTVVMAAATPAFSGTIVGGRAYTRSRLRWSWRPGCPVGPVELRLLRVDHWGFDGRVHRGELVVHRTHARRILAVLEKLFRYHHPIQRLRLVDDYRADDDRSMAANNTSGFNCRRVAGSRSWSEHAFGRAIDLNPLRNPYVTRAGRVSPPAGRPYANRALRAAGMVHGGDKVVRAFAAAGWSWGGNWSGSRDYQHFSSTGR